MTDQPQLIFGGGGIGDTTNAFTYTWKTAEDVSSLLTTLQALGLTHIDSAASYPPGNPWHTDSLLGEAKAADKGFIIDAKVSTGVAGGALNDQGVGSCLDKSLRLLNVSKVNIYYIHSPDRKTPLAETAAAFNKQYQAGKFEKFGLCNYSPAEVEELLSICTAQGFVKPSVFQGHYNALFRGAETTLLPLLRKHNIPFYAFSPLAGGFLTGKVTLNMPSQLHRTRWAGESAMSYYPDTFSKPAVHFAIHKLLKTCEKHGVTLTEASLRWIMHHSVLGGKDAIILGAKRIEQLEGNVQECRKGPLPVELVQAMDSVWEDVKEVVMENETEP